MKLAVMATAALTLDLPRGEEKQWRNLPVAAAEGVRKVLRATRRGDDLQWLGVRRRSAMVRSGVASSGGGARAGEKMAKRGKVTGVFLSGGPVPLFIPAKR